MNHLFNDIQAKLPANKFYPPAYDPSHYLYRNNLLQNILCEKGRHKKVILIEAQAGQGKTVLAAQYLVKFKGCCLWYQVGPEDDDTVLFLTALLSCLMNSLPSFRSPSLERMIEKGEISPPNFVRFANLLLNDLDKFLETKVCFVFDDLHLINKSQSTMAILNYILETSPPRFHFVLTSRRSVVFTSKNLKYNRQVLNLGNEDLALSEIEIDELYNEILQFSVDKSAVRELYRTTEGWIMGLILIAHTLEREGADFSEIDLKKDQLLNYFNAEILSRMPVELKRTILKLSLLDQIPLPLAARFSESHNIESRLKQLSRDNFFLQCLDQQETVFRFHHLFQEFLQARAEIELNQAEMNMILEHAAAWYLAKGQVDWALRYYLKAGNYQELENVLASEGLMLLALNRLATLSRILKKVDVAAVKAHGWLSLYYGAVMVEQDPPRALGFLREALNVFSEKGAPVGELLARAQIVSFHLFIDAEYNEGLSVLEKLEENFIQTRDSLDISTLVNVAQKISLALLFFKGDMQRARFFNDLALEHALMHRMENALVEIYLSRAWGYFGSWDRYANEIESSHHLLQSEAVTTINKMMLRLCYVNYLQMSGDFENYHSHVAQLSEAIRKDLIAKTLSGPYFLIWGIDTAIAEGNIILADRLIREGLARPDASSQPHLRSQFLHYSAFVNALNQKRAEALSAAEESLRLRTEAGGPVFVAINKLIIGGSYAVLGMLDEAERELGEVIKISEKLDEEFLRSGAYAHRAFVRQREGRQEAALEDVSNCLNCLKKNDFVHFYSWVPLVMLPVLEVAVRQGIEVDYAQYLARKRLGSSILPHERSVPVLTIKTLGSFSFFMQGKAVLRSEELTQSQRELLALLICAPEHKMSQEKIQFFLWPDGDPEKTRANLDNLLMRLRKVISRAIQPQSIKNYLLLQKGILSLINIRLDTVEFTKAVAKGFSHIRRKEFWQAGNAFNSAHRHWKGTFLPNTPGTEPIQLYRDNLERICAEFSCAWALILSKNGNTKDADQMLRNALQLNPINDDLVKCRYELFQEKGLSAQAKQVLRDYETALLNEDYSCEEIQAILGEIQSPADESFRDIRKLCSPWYSAV